MPKMLSRLIVAIGLAIVPGLAAAETLTLDWADLVPADGSGVALSLPSGVVEHGALMPPPKSLEARSPFGKSFRSALSDPKSLQPQGGAIRTDLDGKQVRIAGFVTPLAFDGVELSDFFLAPYVGACIHVPPPPANQIILVSGAHGFELGSMSDPVWIEGELRAVPLSTEIADVGYQMVGPRITPF